VFRNYKVGALTSKPYAFIARPWELQVIESFDVFDLGQTKLRVEIRSNQILRILPRIDYNYYFTEWVTNKTRFSYDAQNLLRESYISALGLQNLIVSLVVSWKSVFQTIKHFLFFYQFSIIVGEQLGLRTLVSLKEMALKSANYLSLFSVRMNAFNDVDLLGSVFFLPRYIHNYKFWDNSFINFFIFIGGNFSKELANLGTLFLPSTSDNLLNLSGRNIYFGAGGYDFKKFFGLNFGNVINFLYVLRGRSKLFLFLERSCKALSIFSILGKNIAARADFFFFLPLIIGLGVLYGRGFWKVYSIPCNVSDLNIFFCGLGQIIENFYRIQDWQKCNKGQYLSFYVFYQSFLKFWRLKKNFVIFQGSHNLNTQFYAHAKLPASTHFEEVDSYINIFGQVQRTKIIVSANYVVSDIKQSHKIVVALLNYTFGFSNSFNVNLIYLIGSTLYNDLSTELLKQFSFFFDSKAKYFSFFRLFLSFDVNSLSGRYYHNNDFFRASRILAVASKIRKFSIF
jgi:hypothetical protein